MKDEEKAKEIAEKNGKLKLYLHGFELVGVHFDASPECYDSAMEMAKWKDENFDAFLDYLIVLGDKDIIDAIYDYRGEKLEE